MNNRHAVAIAMMGLLGISTLSMDALAQGSPDIGAMQAGAYKVESYHTQIVFSLLHMGLTNFSGLFSGASGTLQLDPANLTASTLQVSLPIQSVMTTVPTLNEELKGDQWFDAAKFPTATFVSTRITPVSNGRVTITGNLTLHGVTRPVLLNAKFIGAGVNPLDKAYTVGFQATGTIKRSDFGLKAYLPMIGDDIHLTIAGAFERQS